MIVTKTVYLIAQPSYNYNPESGVIEDCVKYSVWPYATYEGAKTVGEVEIDFEIAEEMDPTKLKVNLLEAEKNKLQADFQARLTEIQRQINECLAIEG